MGNYFDKVFEELSECTYEGFIVNSQREESISYLEKELERAQMEADSYKKLYIKYKTLYRNLLTDVRAVAKVGE